MAISYNIYYSETLNLKVNYKSLKLIRVIKTNLILRFYSVVIILCPNIVKPYFILIKKYIIILANIVNSY
jgi:hypothetical protein